jgi:hypothetical protein
MTVKELEDFISRIREIGGNDDTVIKALTKNGQIKDIKGGRTWTSAGFPLLDLK